MAFVSALPIGINQQPQQPMGLLQAMPGPTSMQPASVQTMLSTQPPQQDAGWGASLMGGLGALNDSGILQDLSYGLLNSTNFKDAARQAGNSALVNEPARQQRADEEQKLNKTRQLIETKYPELVPYLDAGHSPNDVLQIALERDNQVQTSQIESSRREQLAGYITDPAAKAAYLAGEIDFQNAQSYGATAATSDWSKLNDGTLFNQRTGETMAVDGAAALPENVRDAQSREMLATQYGLEGTARQQFILTGDLPASGGIPMNSTIQKELFETEDAVAAGGYVLSALDTALTLNQTAADGAFAGQRATIGANIPDIGLGNSDPTDQATIQYQNIVNELALNQLKTIFGAAPTEGERKILLEIQGSVDQPRAVREQILRRAKEAAERRLAQAQVKANGLRTGQFFSPDYNPGAGSTAPAGTVPDGIDAADWEFMNAEERALWQQ